MQLECCQLEGEPGTNTYYSGRQATCCSSVVAEEGIVPQGGCVIRTEGVSAFVVGLWG